ncbi:MAG TPA: hypothetical protein VE998_10830 [Terriglobales bacterium]|nr:hypothetical protein [Terriglobales bacterium]
MTPVLNLTVPPAVRRWILLATATCAVIGVAALPIVFAGELREWWRSKRHFRAGGF